MNYELFLVDYDDRLAHHTKSHLQNKLRTAYLFGASLCIAPFFVEHVLP